MILHEYIYGLFDLMDYTFVEGSYPIPIGSHTYILVSRRVVRLRKRDFDKFAELSTLYSDLEKRAERSGNAIPCAASLLIREDYFKKYLKKLSRTDTLLEQKIYSLSQMFTCLMIHLDHTVEGNPMDYINSVRDDKGIDNARNTLLIAVREFHNYHILTRAPYVYVTDVHCRNIDGMFAYFESDKKDFATQARPLVSYWTPKMARNSRKRAEAFFHNHTAPPIEDLSLARARVYAECQHLSLAIIHAVIALEVVVPKFINQFFAVKGVNKSGIEDFDNKFGLSVRVKAILKIILPRNNHSIIDTAGQAIKYRNDILHEGLSESSLKSVDVNDLVEACAKLTQIIKSSSRRGFSNQNIHSTKNPRRLPRR
jgi:hypothetical protein